MIFQRDRIGQPPVGFTEVRRAADGTGFGWSGGPHGHRDRLRTVRVPGGFSIRGPERQRLPSIDKNTIRNLYLVVHPR